MKKTIFLALFSFVLIFFLLSTRTASAQLISDADACYGGSWVQPTCNPASSNPGSCNILPPLFSGAACGQTTGYLRIVNAAASPDDKTQWIELFGGTSSLTGGKILVGNVDGQWVVPTGGIEINGPIISGSFTSAAPPTAGYNSTGDIASLDSILAGGALRVNGAGNFYGQINAYNRVVVSGSVTTGALLSVTNGSGSGNATTLALRQAGGDVGLILDLNTADSNNINIDYLGYVNATKDFQIRLDSDNNSAGSPFDNKFRINNGSNNPVFIVDETGSVTVNNNLGVSGAGTITNSLTAGTVTTNSGGVGNGAIRGKFVESVTGNTCANNQLLVYQTTGSAGWYCVASTNVGTTTVGTLLQVLQAGADASAFGGNVFIGGPEPTFIGGSVGTGPRLNINSQSNVTTNGASLGIIDFADPQGISQAFMSVTRGDAGGLSTDINFYNNNGGAMSRRMYIHNSGNVVMGVTGGGLGIALGGSTLPAEKLEVGNYLVGSAARVRITDTSDNPELQLQYNTGANDHWGIYNNQSDDSLRIWGNGNDRMSFLQNGYVGIGISNPTSRFTVSSTWADGWNAGIKFLRQNGATVYDARIVNASDGLIFKNYNSVIASSSDAFSFRNAADTKLVTINDNGGLSVYGTVKGNFTDYNGVTCTSGQILIKDASNRWICGSSPSGADNLGDHTATNNLQMVTYDIYGSTGSASADGNFDISGVDNISGRTASFTGSGSANSLVVNNNAAAGNIVSIQNTAGAGNSQTMMLMSQTGGQVGNFIDAYGTSDRAYLDYLGYWNHIRDAQIRIDTDNNGSNSFRINNGSNVTVLSVDEVGNLNINPVGATGGKITGRFTDYLGNFCASGQTLTWNNAVLGWNCTTGSGGGDNLGNHTATQNLNMSNFSITNVNKITVTTIDPVYTIKGEKYATYMAGMTGVKEETTGLVNLVYNKKTGLAELMLDFDTLEKGSDVWLFAQTIKYTENFDKVVVLLTPSFDGRVWYEKDESAHTITIIGKPINSFAKDYEVSYRLTGPRFDYQQWPNTTNEDTDGLIIE